jgi:hypothetical protein
MKRMRKEVILKDQEAIDKIIYGNKAQNRSIKTTIKLLMFWGD